MFKIVEDPSPSTLPSPEALDGAIELPVLGRAIYRPRQPDITSGAGWPSMLFDGAQAPIFEPKVVIMSNKGRIGFNGIPDWPALIFNAIDAVDELAAGFIVSARNGLARWTMEIGTHGPEPGGNVGTNFLINRFSDAGEVIYPSPLVINRATGHITFGGGLTLGVPPNNTLTITPGETLDDSVIIEAAAAPITIKATGPSNDIVVIQNNLVSFDIPPPLPSVRLIGPNGNDAAFFIDAFGTGTGSGGGGFFQVRSSSGTPAAPSAVQAGQRMGGLRVGGYGATGFGTARTVIQTYAAETFTDTAQGSYISIATTAIGSVTTVERMRITDAGVLQIGIQDSNNTLKIAAGASVSDPVSVTSANGIIRLEGGGNTNILEFHNSANYITSIDMGTGGTMHFGRYGTTGTLIDYPMQMGPDGQILVDGRFWVRGGNVNSPNPAAPQPVLLEPPVTFGSATNNALTITPGATTTAAITVAQSGTGGLILPVLTGPLQIGTGTQNKLTITPGASASSVITIQPSGSGAISFPTAAVSVGGNLSVSGTTVSTGQVTAQAGLTVGISGLRNTFQVAAGGATAAPIVLSQGGTGGLTINIPMIGFNNVTPFAKPTGYTAPTGTATRVTFDTGSVTLPVLAEHVKALIDDLTSYGLLGT